MAEVTRVLREMRLGNDGGLVPASGLVPLCTRRRTKLAKDDSAAVGGFVGEIGATNKAFDEIGVGKAERKVAVAVAGNKEATGTGMTKAASWSDFGTCGTNLAGNKPAAKLEAKRQAAIKAEGKREPVANGEGKPEEVAMVTERVPDSFINRVRALPTLRPRPITEAFFLSRPKLLKKMETLNYNLNKLVDLEENVLRQVAAKGHADVVVKYTDGIKKIYPLPGY
ncbi:uncharacterized protein [Miscanthus floridulus]|uniref:uncharacterized protein n=1 Tax=Miscanthus floridulus TaxID=154761 RepID=UPI00345A5A01